jgi:lipoate-protein ligase A
LRKWRLIDMGATKPFVAQTFYEAVAEAVDRGLSPNTIILAQPSDPYVCIGFHQEVEREIDLEYCRSRDLPIIRRSQGGGAVYLDSNQIFYQVVAKDQNETIPTRVEGLFERLLKVTVYVYRKLGLPAKFKPLNDVIVNGRKISGNGASRLGNGTTILVGNIILDLDYDSMASVLKVPSEKFRDKIAKNMRDWVTSLNRELGFIPSPDEVKTSLVEGYEKVLGIRLIESEITEAERKIWEDEIEPRHLSMEWLYMPELRHKELLEGRTVKIAEGIHVVEADHKAQKLIRVRAALKEARIIDIMVSGDFFMVPEEALQDLESSLKGVSLNKDEVLGRVRRFFESSKVQTPGLTQEEFAEAIMKLEEFAEI